MAYLDRLFDPYVGNLARALDVTTKRHALLTKNLANINTPGYKREDVDFHIQLEEETSKGGRLAKVPTSGRPHSEDAGSLRLDGNNVDLEKEVMAIAETELRFQALSEFASKYFSGLTNVIREGRS